MQVTLNDELFNTTTSKATIQENLTKHLPASRSGRTLAEILSLSHPNDLKSYTINRVARPAWGKRTIVQFSHEEGGIEFQRKRADDSEHEKVLLQERLNQALRDQETLVEWQTANLVLHAFAGFAWDYVSIPDKTELEVNNMFDFLDLFYGRFGPKRGVAMRIYRKLPEILHVHMDGIMLSKSGASTDRNRLAHPEISQERLELFLRSLGDGALNQDPLDVALFQHLKATSISKENVERTMASRRL